MKTYPAQEAQAYTYTSDIAKHIILKHMVTQIFGLHVSKQLLPCNKKYCFFFYMYVRHKVVIWKTARAKENGGELCGHREHNIVENKTLELRKYVIRACKNIGYTCKYDMNTIFTY